MLHVESVSPSALPGLIERLGYSPKEAELHHEAGRSEWFMVTGVHGKVPRSVHAGLLGEGITRYEATSEPVLLMGATRGAWRSLLVRFPDEDAWASVGKAISEYLEVPFVKRPLTRMRGKPWYWGERTYLMGILNVTPDSFSDGGRYLTIDGAVAHVERMLEAGADMIDVGGESTRPGSDPVPESVEAGRVVPVVEAIVRKFGAVVSVDTYKASVAKAAIEAGAAIINDVTGLLGDPQMAVVAAELGVPIVVQHIQGRPKDMQNNPQYTSVVPEVIMGLQGSIDRALRAGVRPENIIVDPGFGFGKKLEHNLTLLARLGELRTLGYPVLSGTSRKSMIGEVLGVPVTGRVEGTAATVALSVAGRADIVRVHDVDVMHRTLKMADATMRNQVVVRR